MVTLPYGLFRFCRATLTPLGQAPGLRKMSSMKEQGIKVCCSTGNPSAVGGCGDYVFRGRVCQLPEGGPAAYITTAPDGSTTNKTALVLIYDIFGFDILLTRRFADLLASLTHMRVVMPDVFRGKPWPLEHFPPKDPSQIPHWVETAGSWELVSKDIQSCHKLLLADGLEKSAPLGIIGFCFGGKQAVRACSGEIHANTLGECRFGAGVVLHGAYLGPEDAKHITVPILFMPAGNDPDFQPLKAILDQKPFGSQCAYKRFDGEVHGFAAGRGDWSVEHTRQAIMEAVNLAADFFLKHLPH